MKYFFMTVLLAVILFAGNFEKGFEAVQKGDFQTALQLLWTIEAKKGLPGAQFNFGLMYHTGQGVQRDKIKAYKWWIKAARQGYSRAQNNLDILCGESPWACKE